MNLYLRYVTNKTPVGSNKHYVGMEARYMAQKVPTIFAPVLVGGVANFMTWLACGHAYVEIPAGGLTFGFGVAFRVAVVDVMLTKVQWVGPAGGVQVTGGRCCPGLARHSRRVLARSFFLFAVHEPCPAHFHWSNDMASLLSSTCG